MNWLKRLFSRSPSRPVVMPPFKHLVPGERYRIQIAFADYDHIEHPAGETWEFVGHSFLPYEDGLSLFVKNDSGAKQQIRLQWRAEEQASIIDGLERHIVPAA